MIRQRAFTLIEMIVFIIVIGVAIAGVMAGFSATQQRSTDPIFSVRANELAYIYLEELTSRRFDENDTEDTACSDPYFGPAEGCTPWVDPVLPGTTQFGPDPGETRSTYDDVDDYHLLVEGSERVLGDGSTAPNPACTGFADIIDPGAPETDRQAALGPNVHPSADAYYTASPTAFPLDAAGRARDEYDEYCVEITVHYDDDYDQIPETDGSGIGTKRIRIRVSHPFTETVIVSVYRSSL